MPKYMLLLHDDPTAFTSLSPDQMQQVLERYMMWGDRLRAEGVVTGGQKLADEPGKVLRGKGAQVRVTDGPYSETKEVLGGFYMIEAASYERAVDIARQHPHLDYGGTIEVREVDAMGAEAGN